MLFCVVVLKVIIIEKVGAAAYNFLHNRYY